MLAGATGSASGGMSIALEALGPKYLEMANAIGMSPELLHRIASISSGGLDTLPHNGAVLTLLAVSNCTHKESYIDICITTCIILWYGPCCWPWSGASSGSKFRSFLCPAPSHGFGAGQTGRSIHMTIQENEDR